MGEVVGVLCTEQVRAEPGPSRELLECGRRVCDSAAPLTMAVWRRRCMYPSQNGESLPCSER